MGRVKPAVFPVPVWARPIRSLPAKASGIACCWIGVGCVYPASRTAWRTSGARSSSSKENGASGIVSIIWFLYTHRGKRFDGSATERREAATATEQAGGLSGRDASLLGHYAPTYLVGVRAQATAFALSATGASPGVVN